jgi:hypothetical protein
VSFAAPGTGLDPFEFSSCSVPYPDEFSELSGMAQAVDNTVRPDDDFPKAGVASFRDQAADLRKILNHLSPANDLETERGGAVRIIEGDERTSSRRSSRATGDQIRG